MTELLRRSLLLAGLVYAAWTWYLSPRILVAVRPVDFAKEYAAEYARQAGPMMGAMDLAQEFIARNANPGSVEAYRARQFENRTLPHSGEDLASWVSLVDEAVAGRGPLAERVGKGKVFYLPSEDSVSRYYGAIRRIHDNAGWLVTYLEAGGRDLEFWYHNEPRESGAPAWLLHPARSFSWIWILAGLALYLLVPRAARRGTVRHDPVALGTLDVIAAALAAFFFALPLALHSSTEGAVDDLFGSTGLSWFVAAAAASGLVYNAIRASFRIEILDSGLQVGRFLGTEEVRFDRLSAVHALEANGERIGLEFRFSSGRPIALDWTGLIGYSAVLEALRQAGHFNSE